MGVPGARVGPGPRAREVRAARDQHDVARAAGEGARKPFLHVGPFGRGHGRQFGPLGRVRRDLQRLHLVGPQARLDLAVDDQHLAVGHRHQARAGVGKVGVGAQFAPAVAGGIIDPDLVVPAIILWLHPHVGRHDLGIAVGLGGLVDGRHLGQVAVEQVLVVAADDGDPPVGQGKGAGAQQAHGCGRVDLRPGVGLGVVAVDGVEHDRCLGVGGGQARAAEDVKLAARRGGRGLRRGRAGKGAQRLPSRRAVVEVEGVKLRPGAAQADDQPILDLDADPVLDALGQVGPGLGRGGARAKARKRGQADETAGECGLQGRAMVVL